MHIETFEAHPHSLTKLTTHVQTNLTLLCTLHGLQKCVIFFYCTQKFRANMYYLFRVVGPRTKFKSTSLSIIWKAFQLEPAKHRYFYLRDVNHFPCVWHHCFVIEHWLRFIHSASNSRVKSHYFQWRDKLRSYSASSRVPHHWSNFVKYSSRFGNTGSVTRRGDRVNGQLGYFSIHIIEFYVQVLNSIILISF